jgi:mRNA-degrading endonuclease RelE of RelBE toxin-antitoxin system
MTLRYDIFVEPAAHAERRKLPGHVRQRLKQLITGLGVEPRPHNSKALDTADLDVPAGIELRRIRLDKCRLIYAVNDRDL